MLLTSKQIIKKGIVTNIQEDGIAQVGIDLHVVSIDKVFNMGGGYIPKVGKTTLAKTEPLPLEVIIDPKTNTAGEGWSLTPGVYEVGFSEGCNFSKFDKGEIRHRSSIYRNGVELVSPIWDPGFHCDHMGTFIIVNVPVKIEKGARLGQMVVERTLFPAKPYNGQYQGKGILKGNH